jgi:hypothetical protein
MENDYWEHRKLGIKQVVCAWAIVVAVATLFKIADLIWPTQPALFVLHEIEVEHTDNWAQPAEVEPWERGLPRQDSGTRGPRKSLWLSRVDPMKGSEP